MAARRHAVACCPMSERPAIISIEEHSHDDLAQVAVTLSFHDASYVGIAAGDPSTSARVVGEATLRAVEEVTEGRVRLNLEAIATTDLGGAQVAMAQVRIDGDDGTLVGSALLSEADQSAATVRAVLDAINRRIDAVLALG